ncbi:Sensor histidine kinase YehU [Tepidimonas alkaliphilus]|uniref:Sensor histidine kinase YehU n=1 Tax=Tepidimonas alkaliphilus TaxID=2588942 RepID=A0A554W6Q5_9BURK|nr:histidine kinase [Tepidimonas alkaliphilus]TSE19250.1 Sensor histidine kinase YehU [Tepidimonas alkaliphilus]
MSLPPRFPHFRQPPVLARALAWVLAAGAWAAWWQGPPAWWAPLAWALAPALTLAALAAAPAWWQRRPYRVAVALALMLAALLALAWAALLPRLVPRTVLDPWQLAAAAAFTVAALLGYLDWHHHRLSPALAQARLQALQSRMRPHFLFNSLNSVLALIRRDPARAEALLEDLAELYRALLAEPRTLVSLADELALARTYLAVEQVRLGERLHQAWHVDTAPADALLPPLTVQPLVENAIRHGVEPRPQGACVTVEAFRDDDHLVLFVRNPLPPTGAATRGNGLALTNLRERLALLYGGAARLRTYESEGEFVAQVRLPIRAGADAGVSPAPRRSAT